MKESDFYTVQEMADTLRVHYNTILRAIRTGKMHAFRLGYGKKSSFRIPKTEINRMAFEDLERVIEGIIEKKEKTKVRN